MKKMTVDTMGTPPQFEPPDAKQFFKGLFNITEYIKDHARLIRFLIVIGFWCLVVIGGLKVFRHFFPVQSATPPAAQATITGTSGGTVNSDSSSKQSSTSVSLIHFGKNG